MTCRHETCEEPKSSGRVYCEEHYWSWRQPDTLLEDAKRAAKRVADHELKHRNAMSRFVQAVQEHGASSEQAIEARRAMPGPSSRERLLDEYERLVNQLEAE